MFSNVGGKIKAVAKVFTWLGIILSVVLGIMIAVTSSNVNLIVNDVPATVVQSTGVTFASILSGVLVAVGGSLVSWLMFMCMYGFGTLVENSEVCAKKLSEK